MKRVSLEELPELQRYEALRPDLREAVIAHKRERRVAIGDRVSLVFEDRETVRWQVLEMARVERIRDPRALQQELDVYNELVPGDGELCATLFVEITDLAEIRPALDRLIGIDEHVAMRLGDGAEAEVVPARFDEKQMEEDRIAAVQYLRFGLSPAQQELFADPGCPARLRIDHPSYRVEVPLPAATRASLLLDLAGGRAPLLADGEAREDVRPELLDETPRLRAWRRAADLVELEPREALEDLAAADAALLSEVNALAARLAGKLAGDPQLVGDTQGWELSVGLGDRPIRWRLTPRRRP